MRRRTEKLLGRGAVGDRGLAVRPPLGGCLHSSGGGGVAVLLSQAAPRLRRQGRRRCLKGGGGESLSSLLEGPSSPVQSTSQSSALLRRLCGASAGKWAETNGFSWILLLKTLPLPVPLPFPFPLPLRLRPAPVPHPLDPDQRQFRDSY